MSEEDWFVCPHCGNIVKANAISCKECGSDDMTGFKETIYQEMDFYTEDEIEIPKKSKASKIVVGIIALWLVFLLTRTFI